MADAKTTRSFFTSKTHHQTIFDNVVSLFQKIEDLNNAKVGYLHTCFQHKGIIFSASHFKVSQVLGNSGPNYITNLAFNKEYRF